MSIIAQFSLISPSTTKVLTADALRKDKSFGNSISLMNHKQLFRDHYISRHSVRFQRIHSLIFVCRKRSSNVLDVCFPSPSGLSPFLAVIQLIKCTHDAIQDKTRHCAKDIHFPSHRNVFMCNHHPVFFPLHKLQMFSTLQSHFI